MGCTSIFNDMYKQMTERLNITEDDKPDPNVRCTYCTRKKRIADFDDLKPGDHISMGGKNGMFNFGGRQVTFYNHHAIVKCVWKTNQNSGIATLIHFYSLSFDTAIQIRETKELLDLRYDELYKVTYCHGTHKPEKIIERAERLIDSKKSYGKLSCNCEHFCHWCCIGNSESYQVNDIFDILRQIGTGTLNIGGKIGKAVANIIMTSLDDVAKAGWQGDCCVAVPWGILSVFVLVYLIYCIYRHHCLSRDKAQGLVCSRCCSRQKRDLWLRFFIYCTTQAGGIGLMSLIIKLTKSTSYYSVGFLAGCIAAISAISIALIVGVPKLKKALSPPFNGQMVQVKTTEILSIGDAISFKYGMTMHDGIVSNVEQITPERAKLSVIHYSRPIVFGRNAVIEEVRDIDLTKDVIMIHDYSGYKCHLPDMVIQRARQRVGETKYGMFSNRSCHFCYWAKVDEDVDDAPQECPKPVTQLKFDRSIKLGEDISGMGHINVDHQIGRKHSTRTMGSTWAKIPQDVKEGSLIQFKYGPFRRWHLAVTTEVEYTSEPSSQLTFTVVHYGEGSRPCEEKFNFDLRRDDIWIYKYHPLYRYNSKDVIARARARIDKGEYNVVKHTSSNLTKEIVRQDQDEILSSFDDVRPGDVIIFDYWRLKHAAIVVEDIESLSKENKMADVTIIHYALDRLWSTRTIKQDIITLDLTRDYVYRRNYEEVTYPPSRVVSLAKSRLNEQCFNINSNTSWHLVHWAKVVQVPIAVHQPADAHKPLEGNTNERYDPGEKKMVLLPLVGKKYGYFQRVRVRAWRDLQPGVIIEYSYYWIWHQGILTDVDYEARKVSVIHYGSNTLFSTRTIMKDTFRVDLSKNQPWMYRCSPDLCNAPEVIVARAYKRLGEQKWTRRTNKSWHFCVDCVLKSDEEK